MRRIILKAFILLMMFTMVSCATTMKLPEGHKYMREGTIVSLVDGSKMEILVEGTNRSNYSPGIMLAFNPTTAEMFRGEYHIVYERFSSTGTVQNNWGFTTGKVNTTSTKGYRRGVLKGSQGTVLSVNIPTGLIDSYDYGEALDANGGKYQINLSPNYSPQDVR